MFKDFVDRIKGLCFVVSKNSYSLAVCSVVVESWIRLLMSRSLISVICKIFGMALHPCRALVKGAPRGHRKRENSVKSFVAVDLDDVE